MVVSRSFLEKPSWGEVISDTVNTGLYVLEPEVLDLIPDDVPHDFASELFPRMLAEHMDLYGYVAEGYWCDVGNIGEYMRANADVLYGSSLAEPIGTHLGGGIWVGENVEIAPSAQLFGPIYLGNEVKIKGDVRIYGPAVIRDYTVIDNYNRIERSIIWRNNYVGESCELRGVIITRQCSIKAQVIAYEGRRHRRQLCRRRRRGAACQRQALAAQGDRGGRHDQGQRHLGQPGPALALFAALASPAWSTSI